MSHNYRLDHPYDSIAQSCNCEVSPHEIVRRSLIGDETPRRPTLSELSPHEVLRRFIANGPQTQFKRPPQGTLGHLAPHGHYAGEINHSGLTDLGKMTNPTFQRFDPTLIGKRPPFQEPQKPMKLDLPETPIEMIGKTIGDDIRTLAKGMKIIVYNFSAGSFGKEAHPIGKTHQVKARVYMEAEAANFTYKELIVERFLYERAKAMVSLPPIEKVAFEVTYEKTESN